MSLSGEPELDPGACDTKWIFGSLEATGHPRYRDAREGRRWVYAPRYSHEGSLSVSVSLAGQECFLAGKGELRAISSRLLALHTHRNEHPFTST